MIERHKTLSQTNFCMHQNQDMSHSGVEEPAALLRNLSAEYFFQRVYKYTANITGSDPYWFHKRCKLVSQDNQEGLQGALFFTFSAADNHWKPLVRLLDVPDISNIKVWRAAVHNNPQIVAWDFCRRMERAECTTLRDAFWKIGFGITTNFNSEVRLMPME